MIHREIEARIINSRSDSTLPKTKTAKPKSTAYHTADQRADTNSTSRTSKRDKTHHLPTPTTAKVTTLKTPRSSPKTPRSSRPPSQDPPIKNQQHHPVHPDTSFHQDAPIDKQQLTKSLRWHSDIGQDTDKNKTRQVTRAGTGRN